MMIPAMARLRTVAVYGEMTRGSDLKYGPRNQLPSTEKISVTVSVKASVVIIVVMVPH